MTEFLGRRIGAFGTPAWRRLFLAHLISSVGDELTRIALFVRVYALGGRVEGLATVAIAQFLPSLVFGPLAGVLADRGSRRRWLVLTDLGRVPVVLAIAFVPSLAAVVGLTAVLAALTAVFRPVEAAMEPDLLEPGDITRANAIRVGSRQVLSILGPALAGLLLAAAGVSAALVVDAATYAVSGAILAALPEGREPRGREAGGSASGPMAWKRVVAHPGLRVLFLTQALLVLLLGMQGPLLYDFVAIRFHGGGGDVFAVLMAALGAGALVGSVILSRWWLRDHGLALLFAVLAIDGAALLGFTYARRLSSALLFMMVMGLISAVSRTLVRSYLQTASPPGARGRVLGIFEGMQGPLAVVSLAAVVPLAEYWESAWVLRGISAAEIVVATAGLLAVVTWMRGPFRLRGDTDG